MADPLDFDVTGARNAGFSDAAIADYLATKAGYDVAGARKAGFADTDIIGHLVPPPKAAEATPEPAQPPKKATVGDDLQRGLEQTRSSMQMLGASVAGRHLSDTEEAKAKADRGEYLTRSERLRVEQYETAKANAERNLAETVSGAIQHRKAAEELPISPEYQAFKEASGKGAMDVVRAFWRAPGEVLTSMLAEGAIGSAPSLGAMVVGGPVAGALVAGGQGFLEGYGSKVADLLTQRGVDLSDAAAVKAALADPKIAESIRSDAALSALPQAAAGAASMLVAGKTMAPTSLATRPVAQQAVNIPAQAAVQGALSAGGEAGAQAIIGEDLQGGRIASAGFQGAAQGPLDAAVFAVREAAVHGTGAPRARSTQEVGREVMDTGNLDDAINKAREVVDRGEIAATATEAREFGGRAEQDQAGLRQMAASMTGGRIEQAEDGSYHYRAQDGRTAPLRVWDGTPREDTISPALVDAQRAHYEKQGVRVVYFDGDAILPDGAVDPQQPNTIFLASNPSRNAALVGAHEFKHIVERTVLPDGTNLGELLRQQVAEGMTPEGRAYAEKLFGADAPKRADFAEGPAGDRAHAEAVADHLVSELGADIAGEAPKFQTFLPRVVDAVEARYGFAAAREVVQNLIAGIRDTMRTLRQFFSKAEEGAEYGQPDTVSQNWVTNLEAIHDTLARMYAERFATQAEKERAALVEMRDRATQERSRAARERLDELTRATDRVRAAPPLTATGRVLQAPETIRVQGLEGQLLEGRASDRDLEQFAREVSPNSFRQLDAVDEKLKALEGRVAAIHREAEQIGLGDLADANTTARLRAIEEQLARPGLRRAERQRLEREQDIILETIEPELGRELAPTRREFFPEHADALKKIEEERAALMHERGQASAEAQRAIDFLRDKLDNLNVGKRGEGQETSARPTEARPEPTNEPGPVAEAIPEAIPGKPEATAPLPETTGRPTETLVAEPLPASAEVVPFQPRTAETPLAPAEPLAIAAESPRVKGPQYSPRKTPDDLEPVRQVVDSVAAEMQRGEVATRGVTFGGVTQWLVEKAQAAGLDIAGFRHAIDVSALRHILKRHGDPKIEQSRGQLAVTIADLRRIPDVLAAPDFLVFGDRSRRGLETIGYGKRLSDGSILYFEELRSGRQELSALSLWKYPAGAHASQIRRNLGHHARSDGGGPILVPAEKGSSALLLPGPGDRPSFSPRIPGEAARSTPYSPEQRQAYANVGRAVENRGIREWLTEARQDLGKKFVREVLDPYIGVKENDPEGYMVLRNANSSAAAAEAFKLYGTLQFDGSAYAIKDRNGGVADNLIRPLQNEVGDFIWWVAANRAERLKKEDRENLWSQQDIDTIKRTNRGEVDFDYVLPNGNTTRSREAIYADSLRKLDVFNKNVLDLAVDSGLLKRDQVDAMWSNPFYVPFYRRAENERSWQGPQISSGFVKQNAFKALKGGTEKLNHDLWDNAFKNWEHLIDASLRNRAAARVIDFAVARDIGAARPMTEQEVRHLSDKEVKASTTWVMKDGEKKYFQIEDPWLFKAVSALEATGTRGPLMDIGRWFSRALRAGVTSNPMFMVRTAIRDSLNVVAVAPASWNIPGNIVRGFRMNDLPGALQNVARSVAGRELKTLDLKEGALDAMAGGGLMRIGSGHDTGIRDTGLSAIIDTSTKATAFWNYVSKVGRAYKEVTAQGEDVNRLALYDKLRAEGVPHDAASFAARDLQDFSLHGASPVVRAITDLVPFMNARLQGLYKVGRAAAESDRSVAAAVGGKIAGGLAKRIAVVLGATVVLDLALQGIYQDDPDYRKRTEFDRSTYFWFKFGDTEVRIPKGFEIAALSQVAGDGLRVFFDKEMTGRRYADNVLRIMGDNLSMNPVPQVAKPLLDLAMNERSTGGAIEPRGLERLEPQERYTINNTQFARGASSVITAALRAASPKLASDLGPSPIQIDYLVNAYGGWLATTVVGTADTVARSFTSEPERPAKGIWAKATQGMISNEPSSQSRYVNMLYEQGKAIEEAYATYRDLVKRGRVDEAREFAVDRKDLLVKHGPFEKVKNLEADLNAQIRLITNSPNLSGEQKRVRIMQLNSMKNRAAESLMSVQ